LRPGGACVYRAIGADAAVAMEDVLAKVAGICAEAPGVDAVIGAKAAAAFGDFDAAPSAEEAAVFSAGERAVVGAASDHDAGSGHTSLLRKPGRGKK